MDIFLQQKWLIRLTIFLVLLNVTAMGFIIWQNKNNKSNKPFEPQTQAVNDGRPPKKSFDELATVLKEELNLTPKQEEELKILRKSFFDKEQVLEQTIKEGRDNMNEAMFSNNIDTAFVKKVAREIAENEYKMELYRLEQAQQLKQICTPQQLAKFQDLIREIRDYFQPIKKR